MRPFSSKFCVMPPPNSLFLYPQLSHQRRQSKKSRQFHSGGEPASLAGSKRGKPEPPRMLLTSSKSQHNRHKGRNWQKPPPLKAAAQPKDSNYSALSSSATSSPCILDVDRLFCESSFLPFIPSFLPSFLLSLPACLSLPSLFPFLSLPLSSFV